jgi:hypothetical protein
VQTQMQCHQRHKGADLPILSAMPAGHYTTPRLGEEAMPCLAFVSLNFILKDNISIKTMSPAHPHPLQV